MSPGFDIREDPGRSIYLKEYNRKGVTFLRSGKVSKISELVSLESSTCKR